MSFDTYELKIVFSTNVRNHAVIEFDRSILYHPDIKPEIVLNKYPYFTNDVKYNQYRLQKMTWNERLDFFFNKEIFIERLIAYSDESTRLPEQSKDEKYFEKREEFVEHNVKVMLEILFPTKFPVINDIHTSFDIAFKGESLLNETFLNMAIIDPIITKHFSYLKLGSGKLYTVKRLIWLNDIFNHPLYHKLIEDYRKFDVWLEDEERKLGEAFRKTLNKLYKDYSKILNDFLEILIEIEEEAKRFGTIEGFYQKNGNLIILLNSLINILIFIETLNNLQNNNVQSMLSELPNSKTKGLIMKMKKDNERTIKDDIARSIKGKEQNESNEVVQRIMGLVNVEKGGEKLMQTTEYLTGGARSSALFTMTGSASTNTNALKTLQGTKKGDFERVKKVFDEFQQKFKQRYPIEQEESDFSRLESYVKEPYKDINKSTTNSRLPTEYVNFSFVTLNHYQRPQRESTNTKLQTLIDGVDPGAVSQFYDTFKKLYDYSKGEALPRDFDKDVLNTGLTYIHTNQTSGLRREIYVLLDLIEGEVNNENVSSVYCPFIGDHLGNEFDFLLRQSIYGKTGELDINKWSVSRNRMLFSLTKMGAESAGKMESDKEGKNMQIVATPMNQRSSGDIEVKELRNREDRNKVNEERVNSLFIDRIVNPLLKSKMVDAEEAGDLNEDIQALRAIPSEDGKNDSVDIVTLLATIKKREPKLYDIIYEWSRNERERNNELRDKIILKVSEYKAQMEIARTGKKNTEEGIGVKRYEFDRKFILNSLYKKIAAKLLESENEKQRVYTARGGSSSKKFTRNAALRRQYKLFNFTRRLTKL
jgi:hypothetical protein